MISTVQMSDVDNSRRLQETSNTYSHPFGPTSISFVDPTDELLQETSLSRWTSEETPAFPLPLNASSPKFPRRQASLGFQDNQQSMSSFTDSFTDKNAPPCIPQPSPLMNYNSSPQHLTRANTSTDSKMRAIGSGGTVGRRASTKEPPALMPTTQYSEPLAKGYHRRHREA